MKRVPIGVAPAYLISRSGHRFSADQMGAGLIDIAAMGYVRFQLKVFHRDTLSARPQKRAVVVDANPPGAPERIQVHQFITSHLQPATAGIPAP